MAFYIRVISDNIGLLEIEDNWNEFIYKNSENPFFLSGFVKQYMEYNSSRGWSTLVFVIYNNNTLVGIIPLVMKKKFGVRFVKFLSGTWPWADFILNDQYQEACIERTLDFLFNTLKCHFVELTMPSESPNLRSLKQKSEAKRLYFNTKPGMSHNIISINSSWDDFLASRSPKFRKNFRYNRNKLDKAGSWRIISIHSGTERSNIFKKILDIEKHSWKERWRARKGLKRDYDLFMIWKGVQYTARIESFLKWSVYFLELNNQTLAYTLVLQFRDVAYMVKTSYNALYKKLSPGIYIQNAAIKELFNEKHIKKIDFITDLPYLQSWTSLCLPRVKIIISGKRVLPNIISLIR